MVNPSIMGHSGANLMNTFQRNYFGLDAAKQAIESNMHDSHEFG